VLSEHQPCLPRSVPSLPRHPLSSVTDVKTKMDESHTARKPPAPPRSSSREDSSRISGSDFPISSTEQNAIPAFLGSWPLALTIPIGSGRASTKVQHEGSTARGVLLVIKFVLAVVMFIERMCRWTSGLSHHGLPSWSLSAEGLRGHHLLANDEGFTFRKQRFADSGASTTASHRTVLTTSACHR
jgi:hypothetical protein